MATATENVTTFFWDDDSSFEYPTNDPDIDPKTAPCTPREVSAFARYFGPAVFSVAFVVGLVGNGLVLVVLGRHRCPWHLADCLLFQLAVADLLLVFALPFHATQLAHSWPFGELLCKALGALSTMNSYSTVLLLACLSTERYLVIVRDVQLRRRWTMGHTALASVALWGVCLGLSAVEVRFRTVAYVSPATAVICHLEFDSQEAVSWRLGLRLTSFFLGFFLPLLVMVFCSCQIFVTLCHTQLLRKHLAVPLLLVLLSLFVLCWGPFHGFILVDSLQRLGHLARDCAREKVLDFGLLVTESLGFIHCCLNPLVYAFVGPKFRRELSRLFRSQDRNEGQRQSLSSQASSRATERNTTRSIDYSIMI